jgi:hypothetical protein
MRSRIRLAAAVLLTLAAAWCIAPGLHPGALHLAWPGLRGAGGRARSTDRSQSLMNLAGTKAVTVPQQEADLVQLMVEEAAKRGNEVSTRTLECVDRVEDFHAAHLRSEGFVLMRGIWDPQEDHDSYVHTVYNRDPEPPRDDEQYELGAALVATLLEARSLCDPADGTGIDFMYDHLVVQDLMPLARGTHANILLPSEPLKIGLKGLKSTLLPSAGELLELDVMPGDAFVWDNRITPLGAGGGHLLYRFAECAQHSRRVLWRAPPELKARQTQA